MTDILSNQTIAFIGCGKSDHVTKLFSLKNDEPPVDDTDISQESWGLPYSKDSARTIP